MAKVGNDCRAGRHRAGYGMRQVKTLNVSLTPALHALIARHVASGRFGSASEVVRAALRAFELQEAKQPEQNQQQVSGLET